MSLQPQMNPALDQALDRLLATLEACVGKENVPHADADLVVMATVLLQATRALPACVGKPPLDLEDVLGR